MQSSPDGAWRDAASPPRMGKIESIQVLRAIAALFVVVYHVTVLWSDRSGLPVRWENGNSGVHLFFVISGFIIVYSSARLGTRPGGWRHFIASRLIRVVPLYWLTTSMKLASVLAVPSLALHTSTTPWNILASFLFIPSFDAVGNLRPVLVVGWTLSFEMLFYAAFALALILARDPFVIVAPVMVALALASLAAQPDWPAIASLANPICLEFLFGMVVGRLALLGRLDALRPGPAGAAMVLGLLCLALVPLEGLWQRVAVWGGASSVILASAISLNRPLGHVIPAWVVLIGEASYSLYLTHSFALPVMGSLCLALHLQGYALGVVLLPASVAASIIFALLVYRGFEVPVTRWLAAFVSARPATRGPDPDHSAVMSGVPSPLLEDSALFGSKAQ